MNNIERENELLKKKNVELQRAANIVRRYSTRGEQDKLASFCSQYVKVYIYGAGIKGNRALGRIASPNVVGFIVSKKDKAEHMGVPVFELKEIEKKLAAKDTALVIALNPKNMLEVIPILANVRINALYVME